MKMFLFLLIFFQVTESKNTRILKENYTIQKLKIDLGDDSKKLEKLLGINFDIIEFIFVLNYYTYKKNASNIMYFSYEFNISINYILFDYKNFILYDENEFVIKDLGIDPNSFYNRNEYKKRT